MTAGADPPRQLGAALTDAKGLLARTVAGCRALLAEADLWRLQGQVLGLQPGARVRLRGYTVEINDALNYYILYKDLFVRRLYHFRSPRPDPLVLDCGSNIGMSILYCKHVYPRARIVGFEPDPAVYECLCRNVAANRLADVRVERAAIGGRPGTLDFYSDGKYSSCLADYSPGGRPPAWTRHEVACVPLRDQLTEPVDLLKMNIEGAEYDALASCGERLRAVREMVIEYHHLPGLPRTLHLILALLHEQGFEYLVNDFDRTTNPGVEPPFALGPDTRYYLLIYARRLDDDRRDPGHVTP